MVDSVQNAPSGTDLTIVANGSDIVVPDAELLFNGDYSRSGSDLAITGDDGATLTIVGYFDFAPLASLLSPAGAMLTGDVVAALAGPVFPGKFARATQNDADSGAKQIGRVEVLQGTATTVRTNGLIVQLNVGDPVFEGDVIQTGANSKLGISFLDGTIFNMSGDARMVMPALY